MKERARGGTNRYYPLTTAAVAFGDNRIASDVLTINGAANFSDKHAAIGKAISVSGINLTEADAGNYTVNATASTLADITARALTVTATGANKVYDGLTTAAVGFGDNRINSDVLTINGVANFSDKNAAIGKTISVSGINLGGADAGNYIVNPTASAAANIAARALNVTATGTGKVYDGLTAATVRLSDNRIASDVLTINGAASFSDKNAAIGKTISVSGISLSGADAGNYIVNTAVTTTADITARALTVTAAGVNKVYDGVTTAAVTYGDNRIASDVLNVNGTANFIDKNAATGKTINVSGINLSGTDAGNYTVGATTATTAANIGRLASVTWVGGASGNWFDPVNWAGGAVPDLSNVANVIIPTGVNVSFNNANLVSHAQGGMVSLDTIGSTGSMSLVAGNLNIANSLQLAALSQSGGSLVGTGNVVVDGFTQTGGSVSTTGNFNVNKVFAQTAPGTVAVTGDVGITQLSGDLGVSSLSGKNVALAAISGVAILGSVTVTGTLGVSASGNISQTGIDPISVAGVSTFVSTTGDITLTNAANNFQGPVNASGHNVAVTNANAVALGAVTATGTLGVVATTGNITQIGASVITAVGDSTWSTAAGNNIALTSANNNFVGSVNASGKNIALTDINGITLGTVAATGTLAVIAKNDIAQTGPVTVVGVTTLTSTVGDITLNNPANDFTGPVSVTGKNISLADANAIVLGTVAATGALTIHAVNDITQTGPLTVGGISTLSSTIGDIILTNAANDFVGAVNASGKNIKLTDINGIVLGTVHATGTLDVLARNDITQTGPVTVAGLSTLVSTLGDIILTNPANDFVGAVDAIGKNIALTDVNGIVLGTIAATGTLAVLAKNDITQTGPVTVAGVSTLKSTTGDITLNNPANDFVGVVTATGKNISLTDITGLTVALNATGNSVLVAGGDLVVSGTTHDLDTTTTNGGKTIFGTTIVTGDLDVNSAGPTSQTGVLTVTGAPTIIVAGVDVSVTPPVTIVVPPPVVIPPVVIPPVVIPPVVVPPVVIPPVVIPPVVILPVVPVTPPAVVPGVSPEITAQTVVAQLQSALVAPSLANATLATAALSPASDGVMSDDERRLKRSSMKLQVLGGGVRLPANIVTTNK